MIPPVPTSTGTVEAMRRSLSAATPPAGMGGALLPLWWDAKGDWGRAHAIVAEDDSPEAAWVHAYLHRKEGDLGNARYWYRRAAQSVGDGSLPAEWERIVASLLARPGMGELFPGTV